MTTKQLAQYCADHAPVIHSGVTFMHALYAAVAASVLTGVITWYVSRRGLPGVAIDLNNAKTVVTTDAQKVETTFAAV